MRSLFLLLALCPALLAQSAGDFLFQKKSSSGPLAADWVTPGAPPALFGTTTGGDATSFVLGGGLAISGSTLSASGGAWGSITGTLASQTDLQTALDAKASTASLSSYLTTAAAATTYASLSGSYANPSWIASLAWSKLTGVPSEFTPAAHNHAWSTITSTPTTLAGYGIADAIAAATAATTYEPIITAGSLALSKLDLTGNLQVGGSLFSGGASGSSISIFDRTITHTHGPTGRQGNLFFPNFATVSSNRSYLLPDNATGSTQTIVTQSDTGTVTNAMLAGSIALSKLAQTSATSGQAIAWNGTAWAPTTITSGLPLTGGTLTGVLALPAGSVSAPGLNFGSSGTGWYASASNLIDGAINGTRRFALSADKLVITGAETGGRVLDLTSSSGTAFFTVIGGGTIFFTNGACARSDGEIRGCQVGNSSNFNGIGYDSGSALAYIRPSTTTLQIGLGAVSPTAHLIRGASARAGTDSNAAGASLTLAGGNGTGTGRGGDLIGGTFMTGSSGSTANTFQTRTQSIGPFINLTEGTATNVVSIALPSGKVTGGTATLTVWASDGTDHQALTSEVRFSAVNKAGTITATTSQTDGTTAASAGTLTVTYDASSSGNNLLLRANATSSLTQTILRTRLVMTAINGDDAQTVTPQ